MKAWMEQNTRATRFEERDNVILGKIGGGNRTVAIKAQDVPQPWDTQRLLVDKEWEIERLREKADVAIERIRTAHEMSMRYLHAPLAITFSGGKDSDVLIELARMSGLPVIFVNSHTTVDAPETVYYIRWEVAKLRDEGFDARIDYPQRSMWELIERNNGCPPLRTMRYCCAELKERPILYKGQPCFIATGVRWSESRNRRARTQYEVAGRTKSDAVRIDELMLHQDNDLSRRLFEDCKLKGARIVNPIIDWNDHDVWEFLRWRGCYVNPLYTMGYKRVGCIGCPCSRAHKRDFDVWSGYKRAYIKAFERGFDRARENGKANLLETLGVGGGEICIDFMYANVSLREFVRLREMAEENGMGC